MISRLQYAASQILGFVRNPPEHFAKDTSDYKALRDIVALILLVTLPLEVKNFTHVPDLYSVYLIVVILLVWPMSWVILNISANIFNYYLQWVSYKRVLLFQPDLLITQRIVAYASISHIISAIPISNIVYVSELISIVLSGIGIHVLYKVKVQHGIGLVLIYHLIILVLAFGISILLGLLK